ncbi:MAG: NusG domain II-containing protein [Nitrospinae bacterium]|nr:NusG domain II-containing protein [Nitrospinota bacterium]
MRFTLGDKILIAALFVFNVVLFANWGMAFDKGDWVIVEVNQKEVARLPLDVNRIVHVKGPLGETEVEVREGRARIVRSPCKNKVCIKSGYIRYADRLAACIPNRVVIRIVGETQRGVDAVVG